MNSETYKVVPLADVDEAMLAHVHQRSVAMLRKSLDGLNVVLKYSLGNSAAAAALTSYSSYTQDEIIVELAGVGWTEA